MEDEQVADKIRVELTPRECCLILILGNGLEDTRNIHDVICRALAAAGPEGNRHLRAALQAMALADAKHFERRHHEREGSST